jgi:hypothetical protein
VFDRFAQNDQVERFVRKCRLLQWRDCHMSPLFSR